MFKSIFMNYSIQVLKQQWPKVSIFILCLYVEYSPKFLHLSLSLSLNGLFFFKVFLGFHLSVLEKWYQSKLLIFFIL